MGTATGAAMLPPSFHATSDGTTSVAIRPEIRYDQSLGGNNVFNPSISKTGAMVFKNSGAFTFATDVIVTF